MVARQEMDWLSCCFNALYGRIYQILILIPRHAALGERRVVSSDLPFVLFVDWCGVGLQFGTVARVPFG